ncbi:MAG TPA: ABC transporter permease [Chloroflexota bacterium]
MTWRSRRAGVPRLPGLYRYAGVLVVALLFVAFSVLRPETFPTLLNVKTMLVSQSFLAIAAVGLLFAAVNGEFDLSIGFLSGFVGVLVAWLSITQHWPAALAVATGLASALIVGTINGLLVVRMGVLSLIATLGMGTVMSGLTLWVTGGKVLFGMPADLLAIGQSRWLEVQVSVYVMLAVIALAAFVLHLLAVGRHMYANGGNKQAARMAGVATDRLTWTSMVISSGLAGVAGIMYTANIGAASPEAGVELLLPSFAAIFLGSTMIFPGKFNVLGTATALLLLVILVNGIQQLGAPSWLQPVFNGMALIIAVAAAQLRARRA